MSWMNSLIDITLNLLASLLAPTQIWLIYALMFDNYMKLFCFIQILGNQTKPTINAKKFETKTKLLTIMENGFS
jgi:hypothetical protein